MDTAPGASLRTASLRTSPYGILALAALLVMPGVVSGATYRHAVSSNRIYVEGGGVATLSQIKAALPDAPLDLVDATAKIWLLRANIVVADGTELLVAGGTGDVEWLRLLSAGGSDFVSVTADHGTLSIRNTKITSWNPGTNSVDGNPEKPRAFIRVRSRYAADGTTPLESRMDVINSEIAYLGYYAAESYGLVWKVNVPTVADYDHVNVYGDIINSHLHHNYFGMYSYGHEGGQWTGNHVHDNVMYGFDPHDDSDNLLIEGNDVHDNGYHGIIASMRCNNLVIRGNRSYRNAGNGIMLHRSSDDAIVEDNESFDNLDSGVSIFGSSGIIVRNNKLLRNENAGLRFSVGGGDNLIEDNEVAGGGYGVYMFKGSDAPEAGDDGRPKRNLFRRNVFRDLGREPIKITDGDRNRFLANTFANALEPFRFTNARLNEFSANRIPLSAVFAIAGPDLGTLMRFRAQRRLTLALDSGGSAHMISPSSWVFDSDLDLATVATTLNSSLLIGAAQAPDTLLVQQRNLFVKPSAGRVRTTIQAWPTDPAGTKTWRTQASLADATLHFLVGNLAPGTSYRVTRGTSPIGTFTASANGTITFDVTTGSTTLQAFSVRPST